MRPQGGDVHPQAAPRRGRGQEARLHREIHSAGVDRPAADSRALGQAARRRHGTPDRSARTQPEDVGEGDGAAKKKTTKAGGKKKAAAAADDVARRNAAQDDVVVAQIREAATDVHRDILKDAKPDLSFPVRSLKNVTYSP